MRTITLELNEHQVKLLIGYIHIGSAMCGRGADSIDAEILAYVKNRPTEGGFLIHRLGTIRG